MKPDAIFTEFCPVCGKDISLRELEEGKCENTGKELRNLKFEEKIKGFSEFFEQALGSPPRSIQLMWARRIFRGRSFAALSPPGIGKTVFGIITSLFLARENKKSYILLPTSTLLTNVLEKINSFMEKTGKTEVVAYHASMKDKENIKEKIKKGEFRILITTTQFLSRNFSLLRGKFFDFIFVDDVDSVLRASGNVERILKLLGFSDREIRRVERKGRKGVIMVSTATGRKGEKTYLFRNLLGFDVGMLTEIVRNVEDLYIPEKSIKVLEEVLKKMGDGGIVLFHEEKEMKEVLKEIKRKLKAGYVTARRKKDLERFARGELDYLFGVAAFYGILTRGLDLPGRIKYAVFYGIPHFKLKLNLENAPSSVLLRLAQLMHEEDEELEKALEEKNEEKIRERLSLLFSSLSSEELLKYRLIKENDYLVLPDIRTYIQASGRTSRLTRGGITRGASIVLDTPERITLLEEKGKFYGIEWKPFSSISLPSILKEIEESRKKIKEEMEDREVIKPLLFVVESPNKAKQIAKFFGVPNTGIVNEAIYYEISLGRDVLIVAPSLGHVSDLVEKREFHGVRVEDGRFIPIYGPVKRCKKCGHQWVEGKECPRCGSREYYSSLNQVRFLRMLAEEAGRVMIGTDPDHEGEKIAWDLYNLLKPYAEEIKRAEFHEVTKKAVLEAIENPREFNENMVKAQVVRRIEDRWIGFELSQKLIETFRERNLSAGRAQTPVLSWVVKRMEEHKRRKKFAKIPELGIEIPVEEKIEGEKEIEIEIEKIEEKEINPPPPYSTDAVLRDAGDILHLSLRRTMELLQRLFELGLITYHRTDSVRVSEKGWEVARRWLKENFIPRKYGEGGAHECIRPTRPITGEELKRYEEEMNLAEKIGEEGIKLYDLIFRRFMASQSKRAHAKTAKIKVRLEGNEYEEERLVEIKGGFYPVFPYIHRPRPLPPSGKMRVRVICIERPEKPLFTQAELIKTMKEKGIGRPSTYSKIVEKLFIRGYVIERKEGIIATSKGKRVLDFLFSKYHDFVSEERTRILEEKMQEIEEGKSDCLSLLEELYSEIKRIKD